MLKSIKLIQYEIEYILSQTSLNDPMRSHLIIIDNECEKMIENLNMMGNKYEKS